MPVLKEMNRLSVSEDEIHLKNPLFRNTYWKEYVCGWGAAFINISVTYPINKIIFRQMLFGVPASNAVSQLRDEGIYFLYRGILPPLIQKTLSMAIMFGVYEEVRKPLTERGINVYLSKAAGAMVAGSIEAVLMPFERIQTLLATAHYHDEFKNTYHAFKYVGSTYGLREFYRGLVPVLLRNGPSNIGFFILRDEAHKYRPKFESSVHRTLYEFICGASIGAFLSSLFYPLNVVKVAMQNKLGGEHGNMFKVLVSIYRERGSKIRNIYHGVPANCTRAFLSWGVINTAYENLKKIII